MSTRLRDIVNYELFDFELDDVYVLPMDLSEAHAAARARWQAAGTTLPPTDFGDGRRQNPSTLDDARGALVPLAAGFRLSATQA